MIVLQEEQSLCYQEEWCDKECVTKKSKVSPIGCGRSYCLPAALIVFFQDVGDNKRAAFELAPQLPSYYNHQVEVACRLLLSNMYSVSGTHGVIMEDVRQPLKVKVLINRTSKAFLSSSRIV